MEYIVIRRATPEGAPRDLDIRPCPDFNEFSGERVVIPPSGVVITMSKLKDLLDIWWMGTLLMMSRKALDIVKSVGETNFEAFPVTLATKSGKRDNESTQTINLLNNVSCMDKNASKFDVDEDDKNRVRSIHKLVLDKTMIPTGRHLFRIADKANIVIASSELVEKWKAANMRGVRFEKPEDYKL